MHAAEHDVGRGGEAADLVGLCRAIHAPDSRPERLVATGFVDRLGDARLLEGLRGAVMHLGSAGDETQHDPFGFCGVRRPKNANSVGFEGGRGAPHAGVVPQSPEPTSHCPIQVGGELGGHGRSLPRCSGRSEEHTSELQSQSNIVCRLLLEKKKDIKEYSSTFIMTTIDCATLYQPMLITAQIVALSEQSASIRTDPARARIISRQN